MSRTHTCNAFVGKTSSNHLPRLGKLMIFFSTSVNLANPFFCTQVEISKYLCMHMQQFR